MAKKKKARKAKRRPAKKARRKKTSGRKRRAAKGRKKATRRTTGRKTRRTKAKKKKSGKKRRPNKAFMAAMQPSPALAVVVGNRPLPRTQVVKKVWKYIKTKKLQDPKNRRNIRADANLQKVFKGKKVVNMFQMTKLLNKQLKAA
ncbi:MAG: SWIB/MDM2 domain-containing protein [Bdellovibrionales bacterium]|nr:SWIB/MDM2 domain-containing protein [Bdellovibrionales bacterium]